jgi:ATP/maltotriose-dependent transcriptional regulator MalT
MGLDRARAEVERVGDLAVRLAVDDPLGDLALARGQRAEALGAGAAVDALPEPAQVALGGVALLEEAAAAFERHGALRFRDAAERELRRLGRRIHRRSGPEGFGALTAREREIAEALYLSPRTVETHVRNIFAKLGADSRVEVARIVEQSLRAA